VDGCVSTAAQVAALQAEWRTLQRRRTEVRDDEASDDCVGRLLAANAWFAWWTCARLLRWRIRAARSGGAGGAQQRYEHVQRMAPEQRVVQLFRGAGLLVIAHGAAADVIWQALTRYGWIETSDAAQRRVLVTTDNCEVSQRMHAAALARSCTSLLHALRACPTMTTLMSGNTFRRRMTHGATHYTYSRTIHMCTCGTAERTT
jgi:hypothetical protein